jgi:hypothetical protein
MKASLVKPFRRRFVVIFRASRNDCGNSCTLAANSLTPSGTFAVNAILSFLPSLTLRDHDAPFVSALPARRLARRARRLPSPLGELL